MPAEILFPFLRKEDLQLEVAIPRDSGSQRALDGVVMPDGTPYGAVEIDLADANDAWETIEIDVAFRISHDELLQLLRPGETATKVCRAIVSVACSMTKVRQGFELAFDSEETWYGKVQIKRSEVRGTIQIIPEVVRALDARDKSTSAAAKFAGAIIATGDAVLVVVDRFARSYKGPIQYKWETFSTSHNPWVASRPDDVFFLEPNDVPRLYLNLRWKSLQPILNISARSGIQAGLRNSFAAVIAQCVWTQMYVVAISTIRLDSEANAAVTASGWRGLLALRLAKKLYDDQSSSDALRSLYDDLRNPETAPTLIAKLGSLAHDMSDAGALLDKAATWMRQPLKAEDQ